MSVKLLRKKGFASRKHTKTSKRENNSAIKKFKKQKRHFDCKKRYDRKKKS